MKQMKRTVSCAMVVALTALVVGAYEGPTANSEDQCRFMWKIDPSIYEDMRDLGFNMVFLHHIAGWYRPNFGGFQPLRKGSGWQKMVAQMHEDEIDLVDQWNRYCWGNGLGEKYPRYDREGKKVVHTMDPTAPGAMEELRTMVSVVADEVATNVPACVGVQPASEVRIRSFPSFDDRHAKAFKDATGLDVPKEAQGRAAPFWQSLKDIPADGIIEENHPVYSFYKWFWTKDDGFGDYQNMAVAETRRAFRQAGRGEPFTEADPVTRVPPMRQAGSDIQCFCDWQVVDPFPFQHAYLISRQNAAARGTKKRMVFAMVQGIFGRHDACPEEFPPAGELPQWAKGLSGARFITPPPDMMREALWAVMSRRLDGIGFYSWETLWSSIPLCNPEKSNPKCTNPETIKLIGDMFARVAIPLGPLFRAAEERAPEVAVYDGFAGAILSGRAPYDWKEHFDTHRVGYVCVGANLSPYTLYDADVEEGVPSSIKVILAPEAQVVSRKAANGLIAWRKKGGILLGRDDIAKGVGRDGVLPSTYFASRKGLTYGAESHKNPEFRGDVHDADLRKAIRELRTAVYRYVKPYADSDSEYIQAYARKAGKGADLLFAYSSKRTYGDYVGMWKKVLEKGVPNAGCVSVGRIARAVYDLVSHRQVPFSVIKGRTCLDLKWETNDGNVFLVCDRPLKPLQASVKKQDGSVEVVVKSASGVMVPFAVENAGKKPFYAVLKNGEWRRTFKNVEDASAIRVRNLATGEITAGSK